VCGDTMTGIAPAKDRSGSRSWEPRPGAPPRVALVSMPWTILSEPSLGLAVLKAQLVSEGIEARVFHSNLQLLRYVTSGAYNQIANCWALNEFVFSAVLDEGLSQEQVDALMARCIAQTDPKSRQVFRTPEALGKALIQLRHEVAPLYLAGCAEEILEYQPTMIGFTCMFDQTLAAAALASMIKNQRPDILIALGGYALEGPPGREVLQAFPQIDAIAIGDGEPIIGALARASAGWECLEEIPGLLTQGNPAGLPKRKFEVEESPVPDYSDWFRDLATLQEKDKIRIRTTTLPVESSRGCWYGQKAHCVFCGIDEETLKYRQKQPSTVLKLLGEIRERHGNEMPIRFSDYILPHTYYQELLPQLARIEPRYNLHCELKANQNPERMKALAEAGFTGVQPGIESFDSNVLRLMKKGVTGIHNVYCLKLCYIHRVQVNYNILFGFPGELAEWYRRMVTLMPRLYHFAPPISRTEVIVTRFAPLHGDPEIFQIKTTPRHHICYDALFSRDFLARTKFNLDNYAYYFERYHSFGAELKPLYHELILEVEHWKNQHHHRKTFLSYSADGGRVHMRDSRFGEDREICLNALQSRVYLACDGAPRSVKNLSEELGVGADELNDPLEFLDEERLVWREGDQVLGLAAPDQVVQDHLKTGWIKDWTSIYV
jgi:ribosomal peptide maturation radical SAM protein 1